MWVRRPKSSAKSGKPRNWTHQIQWTLLKISKKSKRYGAFSLVFSSHRALQQNKIVCLCVNLQYGWYWGPISSEAAEKLLSNEPDGSFIVRDSSDDHYIFSLTFKLNNCVRHVRIEQDQGTFSFGSCAKFKSRTIMEFIENAVESSRSGR